MVIFNIVFAMLNIQVYMVATYYINTVGMAILFVLVLKEISEGIRFCTKKVLRLLIDKLS